MGTPQDSKYVLYGGVFTRSLLVEMVLAEGGIAYEFKEVDILKQEHRSSQYLQINAAGWVPSLITPEGDVLHETPAINLYLADRHGLTQLAPAVTEPDRGRFLSGLFYITGELEPAMKRYWFSHRYGDGERHAAAVRERAYDYARECFSVIDDRLAQRGPFHLEERFSLVDLMTAFWALSFDEDQALDGLEHIQSLIVKTRERSATRSLFEQWCRNLADY